VNPGNEKTRPLEKGPLFIVPASGRD